MKTKTRIVFIILILLQAEIANGWIYPEHRYIGIVAVRNLSPADRAILDKLWAEARKGFESRLTDSVIVPLQGVEPKQLDFAAWMGIAGDHSCSPCNMLNSVLHSQWILDVADVAAMLKDDLKEAENNSDIINAIRNSDIRYQRVDLDYATRAGSNSVHFLLDRDSTSEDSQEYLDACTRAGGDLNALGAYVWFHTKALLKISRCASGELTQKQRSAICLAALADEAFALHFLEDAFAAGHIAGSWGSTALKKGTHDYYNEKGLEVITWNGKQMVVMGDAYMRQRDADTAAIAVRMSLEQIIAASNGGFILAQSPDQADPGNPDTLNICRNTCMPDCKLDYGPFRNILLSTPMPGLASGEGALPRFRSEIGFFLGASTSLNLSTIFNGFGNTQNKQGGIGGLEANLMVGYGLDGILNESGDGLIFLQLGWRNDSPSTSRFLDERSEDQTNSITSYIPGRSAYNLRLRLPFWLIPGDMLIASPFLAILSPETLRKMMVTASNGGLIPWQSGLATSIGRFQFIAGREIAVSLYGLGKTKDALLIPQADSITAMLTFRSTKLDFPFLEYRPLRTFTQDQTFDFKVQFSFGVDMPYKIQVIKPVTAPAVTLYPVWNVTLRLLFDYRHYL